MTLTLKRFLTAAIALSMGAAALYAVPASAQEPEPGVVGESGVERRVRPAKHHRMPAELREKIRAWKEANPDATKEDMKVWLEENKPTEEERAARFEEKIEKIQEKHPDVSEEEIRERMEERREVFEERRQNGDTPRRGVFNWFGKRLSSLFTRG